MNPGKAGYNRKHRRYGKRPDGENWFGAPTTKATILEAARRSVRKDGTIDKEKMGNLLMGWGEEGEGGWTDVRRISFQHGHADGSESRGRGKGRRPKREKYQ